MTLKVSYFVENSIGKPNILTEWIARGTSIAHNRKGYKKETVKAHII